MNRENVIGLAVLSMLVLSLPILASSNRSDRAQAPQMWAETAVLAPLDTTTLYAVADAYVDSATPTQNYGSVTILYVGNQTLSIVDRALFQFTLSSLPSNAIIDTANFRAYMNQAPSLPPLSLDIGVYRITESWSESSVVWGNQPAVVSIGKVTGVGMTAQYYEWEVTGLAQDWLTSPATNFGLELRSEIEGTVAWRGFASREAITASRPQLVIEFHLPACNDPQEPNDTFGQAFPISPSVEYLGCIPTPSDLDYFRFDVVPNTAISVELFNLPANYDLYLYDPAQALLDSSANAGTTSEMVEYTTGPAGGQFYAKVQSGGEWDLYNPYALKLTLTPVPVWPDLVVNDVWHEDGQVCYEIENIGQATALQGHHTALHIDGMLAATDSIDVDLAPSAAIQRCFAYQWQCTLPQDTLTVCADYEDDVAESDESNNCIEEIWTCDTTPPAIDAVADAYVDSATPTTNYGTASSLYVGALSTSQEGQALVWFDLSPLNGVTVQTATLELYRSDGPSSPETLSVCVDRILENWDEMNVNWANQPSRAPLDNCNLVGVDIAYYDWDVTGLVQEWVDGTYPNYGLLLRAESETTIGWRSFNSREVSTNRPRLVISYTATLNTSDPQLQGLRRLQVNSTVPVRGRFRNGIPAYIHTRVSAGDTSGDPLSQARAFLTAYKDLYRLTDPTTQFRLIKRSVETTGGHVVLQQMYNGVPVYAAELSLSFRGNQFASSNGAYLPELKVSTTPSVTLQQAEQAAKTDLFSHTSGISATIGGQTALIIFDPSLWTETASNPRLAWRVNVGSGSEGWTYYVDAQTGKPLDRFTRNRTELDLEVFTGNNNTSGNCWNLGDDPSTLWFTEDGAEQGANIDADGWSAYNSISPVYDYYREKHERRSYDGDDAQIELFVHVDNLQNSYWIGGYSGIWGCDIIEFGDGWPVQDIVGHEFTHGVNDYEYDPPYRNQPGALDESLADTFGEFVEEYAFAEGYADADHAADWMVGEDIVGRADPLRDMTNPPRFNDPDHYSDRLYPGACAPSDANDYCGVHSNSGILNKAAWMISSVGIRHHNDISVTGLGVETSARIFYHTLKHHLNANSQFIDMRDAMVEVAEELYGTPSTELCSVRNAYASVGLGDSDTDCDGQEDPTDTDDDNDLVPDRQDNCDLVANPDQDDNDRDGQGDWCDPDDDNDGWVDGGDNCHDIANPSQLDTDHDGIGEACDDQDYDDEGNPKPDGIPNRHGDDSLWDNCPDVYNPDQANHDDDNQGDACDTDDDNDGILDDGDHSGEAGDHYCTCGNNWLCDDNAPFDQNHDQDDDDCDGVGQVADNCPNVPNPYIGDYPPAQQDNDQDGLGDVCDDDDDNDGVLDPDDNCQYHANLHQIDIDRNGIGLTCDWDEAFMLSADAQQVAFFIRFGDMSPVSLPIFPCWGDGCPDENSVLPEGQRAYVSLAMPEGFGVRISDDAGSLVKRDHTGLLNKTLPFLVHPSYRFDFASMSPGAMGSSLRAAASLSDTARYAQRPLYYLELWPTAETIIGQSYTVRFDLASFAVKSWVYLPVITKNP